MPVGHGFVVAAAGGEREFSHQALMEFFFRVGELDGADAFVGGGAQHAAQRRIGDGVADYGGHRATTILFGRQAELAGGAFVEAAAGAVSGGVEGGGYAVSGLEVVFDLAEPDSVHVGFGGNAEHGFEGALQMERAAAEFFRQLSQSEAVFYVLLDEAADGADQSGLRISVDRLGTAAKAGTVSGLLGFAGAVEEAYVLAPRASRRATGAAKDAGAGNGKNEGAVEGGVAVGNGLPAAGFNWVLPHDGCLGKYRIGGHADNIGQGWEVGYPNVAVKVNSLENKPRYAFCISGPEGASIFGSFAAC